MNGFAIFQEDHSKIAPFAFDERPALNPSIGLNPFRNWLPDRQRNPLVANTRAIWAFAAIVEVTRWTGPAFVYAAGASTTDEVVFGEPGDLVLLGSRSLEGLNLKVDPVAKTLTDAGPMPVAAVT